MRPRQGGVGFGRQRGEIARFSIITSAETAASKASSRRRRSAELGLSRGNRARRHRRRHSACERRPVSSQRSRPPLVRGVGVRPDGRAPCSACNSGMPRSDPCRRRAPPNWNIDWPDAADTRHRWLVRRNAGLAGGALAGGGGGRGRRAAPERRRALAIQRSPHAATSAHRSGALLIPSVSRTPLGTKSRSRGQ
jgi:hypothetical protein